MAAERVLTDDAWHTLSYRVEPRSENIPFCIELQTSRVWHDTEGGGSYGILVRGDF